MGIRRVRRGTSAQICLTLLRTQIMVLIIPELQIADPFARSANSMVVRRRAFFTIVLFANLSHWEDMYDMVSNLAIIQC